MNSVGIDTFLKATQAAPKAKPPAPSEGGGEFNDYLREAAIPQPQPAQQRQVAPVKPTEAPAQPTSQEQDSASSSDEQSNPTVDAAEQVEEVVEEQPIEAATDEVLLSVAAIAASSPEVVPVAKALKVVHEVVLETTPVDAPRQQPETENSATQDFLPIFEEAATAPPAAPLEGELAAPTTELEPVKAAYGDDALLPVTSQGADPESVPSQVIAQETAQEQSDQQVVDVVNDNVEQTPAAAVAQLPVAPQPKPKQPPTNTAAKSDGEADESKSSERKAAKPIVVDKQVIAEQLVAQVSVTVTEDSNRETKHKATAEAGSTSPVTQANSQTQQPQAADRAQADAQATSGDQESRMPTIDRTRFVQRVANAFRSAQQNDGHIQMRLSPPELGSLRIEIAVRHGVLSANLETETADARRVLLDNLPALRQRLAEQEIRIEKFEVDIRREGSQSDGQAGAQDRQAQQQSQRAAAQNRIRTTTTPEVISARVPRPHTVSADTGLDVRI